jgi:hypothetical protein
MSNPAPVVLQSVLENHAGLLVFGPEPDRVRRRTLRRAFAQVRERAPCLLWTSARVEAAATRR